MVKTTVFRVSEVFVAVAILDIYFRQEAQIFLVRNKTQGEEWVVNVMFVSNRYLVDSVLRLLL